MGLLGIFNGFWGILIFIFVFSVVGKTYWIKNRREDLNKTQVVAADGFFWDSTFLVFIIVGLAIACLLEAIFIRIEMKIKQKNGKLKQEYKSRIDAQQVSSQAWTASDHRK